jgi:hypothetical protein
MAVFGIGTAADPPMHYLVGTPKVRLTPKTTGKRWGSGPDN